MANEDVMTIEDVLNEIINEITHEMSTTYDDCDFDFHCGMEAAINIIKEKMKK